MVEKDGEREGGKEASVLYEVVPLVVLQVMLFGFVVAVNVQAYDGTACGGLARRWPCSMVVLSRVRQGGFGHHTGFEKHKVATFSFCLLFHYFFLCSCIFVCSRQYLGCNRWEISNATKVYSSFQLTAEEGGEFVWSGKRQCALQVLPSFLLLRACGCRCCASSCS